MVKKCLKCGEVLNSDCFYKDPRSGDGLRCYCKGCVSICRRSYYLKNKEKSLQDSKKYRKDNPEYFKEYNKIRYQNNKDKLYEFGRAWKEKNKDYKSNRKKYDSLYKMKVNIRKSSQGV